MNFSFLDWQPIASNGGEPDDDLCNDWLGGEAWVTPQPFDHEGSSKATRLRGEDHATDWNPL